MKGTMEMSIPMVDFKLLARASKTLKVSEKVQGHSQSAANFAFLFTQSFVYSCEANGEDMNSSFLSHFSVFSSALVTVSQEQALLEENEERRGGFKSRDCSLSG